MANILARNAVKHDWNILHYITNNEVPPCRLKSRQPYNREAQEMLCVIPEDRSKDACIYMYVYIYSPDMDIQKYTVTMKIIVNSVKISSPIGTISNSEVVDLQ